MSDRKPFVRFVIEVGGELKRLVTVREVAKGRLIIKTTVEGTHAIHNGKRVTIENLKHTVQPSGRSETRANLIHGTTLFSNSETSETHLLTHAIRDDRLQPVYSRRVLDLSPDEPADIDPKDDVRNIGSFDPVKSVLLYQLWVTSRRGAFRFPMSTHYGLRTALFSDFAICLPYCFTDGASENFGYLQTGGTSSLGRLTPEEAALGHIDGKISEGAPPETAIATVIANFKEMLQPPAFGEWKTPSRTPSFRYWSRNAVPFSAQPKL